MSTSTRSCRSPNPLTDHAAGGHPTGRRRLRAVALSSPGRSGRLECDMALRLGTKASCGRMAIRRGRTLELSVLTGEKAYKRFMSHDAMVGQQPDHRGVWSATGGALHRGHDIGALSSALARGVRLGSSSTRSRGSLADVLAADLANLPELRGLTNVAACRHSLGAVGVSALAVEHPARLAALISVDPGYLLLSESPRTAETGTGLGMADSEGQTSYRSGSARHGGARA